MLLRDTDAGPEVFLQRRVKAMEFAPSVSVFPGGGVDERDMRVDPARWQGPAPSWWAERFGCAEGLAAALVCAAVRETFEECGVLLAGGPGGTALEASAEQLAAARSELVDSRGALPDVLAEHDWVLRADLLRPWSNWITPEIEKKRYDTRFFLAELPEGQRADDGTTEVTEAGWYRPTHALDEWKADRIELLPPTWVTLEQLAELTDVAAGLRVGDGRTVDPVMPKVRRDGERIMLTLPGEFGYEEAPVQLRPRPTKPPATARGLLPERTEHPVYETARAVTPTATVLLADNPSHMTLEGTNTWLLRGPGSDGIVVVDPGPDDERHLRRIAEQGPVELILLTHHHPDHVAGAALLAERVGAPVRAFEPSLVSGGGRPLVDREVVDAAGLRLRVLHTPGHTADSVCFVLEDAVLTGDTVLGRGTTVIADPDGRLGDYLDSLARLIELPGGLVTLPGHGPEVADTSTVAKEYLAHREERLDQVRSALRTLGEDATARQVVELVYADVDQVLWPAAEWSVRAQLEYLRAG
jgi:glyoxylase-like metal-dependent hydrolase (beta-lactamase superfamily II)/8-oxo-dGTP pyrophosphatase MutT (NUDIX family)